MSKLGIAAALAAALGGAGYTVHRVYAAPSPVAAPASASASASTPSSLFSVHAARHARHFAATSAPPALPPTGASASTANGTPVNTCATLAAHMTSVISQYKGSAATISITSSELEKALAHNDGNTHVFFVAGSNGGAIGDDLPDLEQQCADEGWSQAMIDCLSSMGSGSDQELATCQTMSGGDTNLAPPTAAQLAAVTDDSCAAVGSHLLALATGAFGSDTVTGDVIAAMNAELAAKNPIATICETTGWPESQRRCLAAVSESDQAFACR
jgi:hypothetical protein